MTGREHCDEILRLIDEALGQGGPPPKSGSEPDTGAGLTRLASTKGPVSAELVLAQQVQSWVERVAPGERTPADAAIARALAMPEVPQRPNPVRSPDR